MKIAYNIIVLRVNYRRFAGKWLVQPGQRQHHELPLAAFNVPWHRPGRADKTAVSPLGKPIIRLIDINLITANEARST